jgi:hypothetical protein
MVMVYVEPVPVQPLSSVTVTVIAKLPVWVGVPESTPFAASVSPAGSEPLASEYVSVPIAPLLVKVSLNGAAAVPLPFAGLLTVMVWQAIVIV